MAHTTTSIKISASPGQVWQLIGGFDSLPNWLPYIPSSEVSEGGRVRHLANPDGDTIVERLEVFNDKERYYTYSIMKHHFRLLIIYLPSMLKKILTANHR